MTLSWNLFFSFPLWIILLVTLAVLLYLYGTQPFRVWKDLCVIGPAPYPFVGNVSEMYDQRLGVQATIRQWQKKYGRMFGIYIFRQPSLVVTDPDVLSQIFVKDFSNFTDRFLFGDLQNQVLVNAVFFAEGSNWQRIRRTISPIFSSAKLKLLIHHMSLTARRLGENMKECAEHGEMVDVKEAFGNFVLDVVCGTVLGLDTNSTKNPEHLFIKHSKSLITVSKKLQIMLVLAGVFPLFGSLFKILGIGFFNESDVNFFEKNITALIQERQNDPDKQKNMDLLQLLMEAETSISDVSVTKKKLSTQEIVAQCILFIVGAYETTSASLEFLSYELAKNQEVQTKVIQEIQEVFGEDTEPDYDKCLNLRYMDATISETLRMHPPIHILQRLTEHDCKLKDVSVPAKSVITIPLGNIGRDPEFFTDPDSFRPERFLKQSKQEINPVTFLSFGYGPRFCIGMRLALMEMKIALVHILRSVRIIDATPDVLDIEDFTGVLKPRIPIKLRVQVV